MENREGFTLAELVLAVFIFSFIAASLATIVSTTNRQMFQNYRKNIIKTNVLISMKAVQRNLAAATRVDAPAPGASGTVLAFAENVDQGFSPLYQGCYPVIAGPPATWHYFCLNAAKLYYYTGNIAYNAGTACGTAAPAIWNQGAGYAVPACGTGGTLLLENVWATLPGGALFSRVPADGINEADTVRVLLRSRWLAAAAGMGATQRDVDVTLDSVVRFNRSK
ncbi:MAG: hypothetical protein HY550_10755 [Elusimicrobia bacterium]|nr:hypothetical protein [Elusimicrobiota bacterium]